MKKFLPLFLMMMALCMTAYASDTQKSVGKNEHKVKMTVGTQEIFITLYDTPAANSLYEMLPLKLTFEDYNGIEKISYLPKSLTTTGEPNSFDPNVGDLCLYAPWGNLSIFYKDFRLSNGLISLGRIDNGINLIASMRNDFNVTLERIDE